MYGHTAVRARKAPLQRPDSCVDSTTQCVRVALERGWGEASVFADLLQKPTFVRWGGHSARSNRRWKMNR